MGLFRRENKKWNFNVFIVFVFSILLFVFYFFLFNTALAQNGSLYFSPSSGRVSVGQTFSLVLRVNTGGTAINAVEGSVVFDQSKLSVVSISKSGSIFTIWAEEPKFSNSEGEISFAGGVPSPGYSGSNGLVTTITFRAKTGTTGDGTDITLVSGGVLVNDGYGTNILSSLGKATYVVSAGTIEPTPAPTEPEAVVPGLPRINVTSSTHPDQTKWYSNNNPSFKWELPANSREVLLVLSRRLNSPPIISYIPPISERQLEDVDEGEWYLNARVRTSVGTGPVSSFKFNIDTQPPSRFNITRLDNDDPTNPRPELLFESSDLNSGIDRYEIKVGEGEWVKIEPILAGKAYALPVQKPGQYSVEVKAIDKAENSTSSKTEIEIKPIKSPVITEITQQTNEGKPVIIKGTSGPDKKIIIEITRNGHEFINLVPKAYAKQINSEYFVYETIADESGSWSIEITDLPAGKYKVAARAEDERQAVSQLSNIVNTQVRGGILDIIFRIFDWLVNLISGGGLFIAFIAALVGLILALIELIKIRAGKWLKKIGDWIIIKMARRKSAKKITHIIKDMQDELKFLNQIAKRRPLGTEEKYLKSKISSYIKMLKYIDKEID